MTDQKQYNVISASLFLVIGCFITACGFGVFFISLLNREAPIKEPMSSVCFLVGFSAFIIGLMLIQKYFSIASTIQLQYDDAKDMEKYTSSIPKWYDYEYSVSYPDPKKLISKEKYNISTKQTLKEEKNERR